MKFELVKNPPMKTRSGSPISAAYHFTGTLAEFYAWSATLPKMADCMAHTASGSGNSWAGFRTETMGESYTRHFAKDALADLQTRKAELHSPVKAPAKPTLSPVGASFSIGRVLQGHPVCAFRRPRVSLPPKNINIALSTLAYIKAEDIAASVSKIAHAAWDYHLSGGVVNITMHNLSLFKATAPDGAKGLIISIKVSMADLSQLATVLSVQFDRGCGIPAAMALSPLHHDSLTAAESTVPGVLTLTGDAVKDQPILDALRIG